MEAKPKRKPTKIDDLTKEQIREAILKKRECTIKAQCIVESLIDSAVTGEYLLECLPEINQSHFDDVIEERFITHVCGYPLCAKILSEKDIPRQKYRISTRTNKVYDISARKKFCSNPCYQSAMYIKKQMLTSPLWFRDYEVIPSFQLLPLDTHGCLGEEVDVSIIEKVKIKENTFASINDFASATLQEIAPDKENKEEIDKEQPQEEKEDQSSIERNKEIVNEEKVVTEEKVKKQVTHENDQNIPKTIEKKELKPRKSPLNIVGDIIEKPEQKIDPILTNIPESVKQKTKGVKKNTTKTNHKKPIAVVTAEIEKCLAEWFSLDTLIYLFGKEKVKELVAEKGEDIKNYFNNITNSIAYTSNSYDQYQQLCRKLNMLELEERKFDAQTINKETKPLPDYKILQEESNSIQLKVRAFYAGETEMAAPAVETATGEPTTQLPLVEKHAQNAIRRKIVLEQLNKSYPDLLRSLGIQSETISTDIRLLINTFNLKANNIMFKPLQWILIVIVIIKLLSFRDGKLRHLLQQPMAFEHLQLLLLSFGQDGGYLDRLVSWLTDVDRLLGNNSQSIG